MCGHRIYYSGSFNIFTHKFIKWLQLVLLSYGDFYSTIKHVRKHLYTVISPFITKWNTTKIPAVLTSICTYPSFWFLRGGEVELESLVWNSNWKLVKKWRDSPFLIVGPESMKGRELDRILSFDVSSFERVDKLMRTS